MSLEILEDANAHCTMCKQFTYRIVWRPEKHYVAGAQFEIRSHCLRAFLSWRYAKFLLKTGDITMRWKFQPTVSELRLNWDRILFRARLPYGVRKGEPVEMEMTLIPPVWAGIDNTLSVWIIDTASKFAPNAPEPRAEPEPRSECTLAVTAGPVERLSIYSHPMPGADGSVRTCVVPEDRFGNPGQFVRPQACELSWMDSAEPLPLQGPEILHLPAPTETARATVSVPMGALTAEENVANARREGNRMVVTGNPVWPEAPSKMQAAFGEIHWHTDFSSDGQRSIREALRCARDELNMNFAAPGDHNTRDENWTETVAALEEFNADGEFATFFGWENATGRGHENYYFTDPEHPLVCGGSAGVIEARPDEIADKLREIHAEHDFFAVPHHTNSVAETRDIEEDTPYWHPYPWIAPADYLRLVEIMQQRGNQERNVYSDAWRGWHQNYGASVQDALALGYKIGFTGGTDNHCGWPSRAFAECEGIGIHPPKSVILTGVWTPRIERQAVFDSLKNRHTWAVWDTRALVHFTVNGAMAGDEIAVQSGTEMTAHIRLSAEAALQTVELVSEGAVVWQSSFDEMDIDLDVPLGQVKQTTYYYLRALQRDGGIIYASPVFVEVI